MKPILIADWTTPRCSAPTIISFTQDEEEWCDFKGYQDLGLLIDCTDINGTAAGGGIAVSLHIESSPTVDDALFQPCCPPITLTPSGSIFPTKTIRIPATQGLARFVRWRISCDGSSSGSWGATFRIRAIPIKSRFFVPPDIAGCQLWVRADLGITLASGSAVSDWVDQSGASDSNRDFTQATGAKRPTQTLIDAAYNNAATLSFGSSDLGMTSVGTWAIPGVGTFFVVGNGDGASGNRTFFQGDHTNHVFRATSTTAVEYIDSASLAATVSTTANKHVYAIDLNAATSKIYQDSVTALATGDPGVGVPTTLSVGFDGVTASIRGKIAELIMYDNVLSDADRTKVMRYLGARYGIQITP